MNAYHDDAIMSMHMAYPEWCGNVQGAEKLSEYMVRLTILHNSKPLSGEAFPRKTFPVVSYPYFKFLTFKNKLTGTVKKLDESIRSYKTKNIFTTRKTCNLRLSSRASEIGA